jgi:hypothetical protein
MTTEQVEDILGSLWEDWGDGLRACQGPNGFVTVHFDRHGGRVTGAPFHGCHPRKFRPQPS